MARIRTIKPEFPQSESTGRLSRDARLLFIQLWTIADDEGRARASSRMLASLLYPYDDDAKDLMTGWLAELEANEMIRIYNVDGSHYLEISNWLKHQKIDHASKSRLPCCPANFAKPREASRSLAPDLGPRTSTKDTADAVSPRYAFESGIIRLSSLDFEKWKDAYGNLDLKAELLSLTEWAGKQGPKWFHAVSGALAKRNRDVGIRRSAAQRGVPLTPSGQPYPEGIV